MSDANNYFDFLRDGIKAICETTIPRLQELRRKLNELKPTELSITGRSSIHGIRLSNQLRMDITAEMLKPHANRARREAAARSGNKNLPKRLFKRDRQKSKPPD
jgi:glutamate/tyrosine decarboxylase-like PLP-dependent enzyme